MAIRYIVLSNDADRVYRLFDTLEPDPGKMILRKFSVRLTPNRIAGAANRHWADTGAVPRSWPWE